MEFVQTGEGLNILVVFVRLDQLVLLVGYRKLKFGVFRDESIPFVVWRKNSIPDNFLSVNDPSFKFSRWFVNLRLFVRNKKNEVTSSFGRSIPNTMSKLR